jgi:hypothetical protein
MSTRRKFTFPVATLNRTARLLHAAITDPAHKAAMEERLGADFAATFDGKFTALTGTSIAQAGRTGDVSTLTQQQKENFKEMERLTAGARRTARLAFPGQDTVLRAEFQIGIHEPQSVEAELERAGKTHAAALKYAAELKAKGWIAADTTLLGQAIAALAGSGIEQDGAFDERLGLTNEKVIAANAVYDGCLTIQNAARLQYPAKNDAAGNAQNITERANFLLDEFPPRDRSQPDGGTQGGDTPPAPPAP